MAQRDPDQAQPTRQPGEKDMASWKPGSEANEAKNVGGTGDFGVPVGSGSTRQREYVSENTKLSDPGMAKPFAWEHDGVRDHGAGARDEGTGSGSEGDVDTDVIGVGTGGSGIAASGPGDAPGMDDSDGTSNEFASPLPAVDARHAVIEPARGRNQTPKGQIGGANQVGGSVMQGLDMQSGPPAQGADAATNPAARGDDSFAGEVSSGEAQGQNLPMSPSSDSQGNSQEENQEYQRDIADEG